MEFNTSSTLKKRRMIFAPDVNPNTFLMFFEKGSSGYSYSVRDYSIHNRVSEKYAKEFHWSADELCQRARYMFDAPTIATNNLSFWHDYTILGNQFLRQSGVVFPTSQQDLAKRGEANPSLGAKTAVELFPMLDMEAFQTLPKSRKTIDVERMLTSAQSEDWVTWNLLRLILRTGDSWWRIVQDAILAADRGLKLPLESNNAALSFWRITEPPRAYEAASRKRMLHSGDPLLTARASDPKPVEGNSEIDVVFEVSELLVFVEAKLGSDISMQTTYDPSRNQIARNIDCLIDESRGRIPMFWMFVRDLGPKRAYVQLMREYRDNPGTLARDLPHRDPAVLEAIAQRLIMVTWRDLGRQVCAVQPEDDELVRALKNELWRRIS